MKSALLTLAFIGAIFGSLALADIFADWFCALIPDLVLSSILMWGIIIGLIIYSINFIREAYRG